MAIIRGLLRLLGYILLAPFLFVFALFFGLPLVLGILIAESFPHDDLHDFRVVCYTLILAVIQNVIILYIAREVFLP